FRDFPEYYERMFAQSGPGVATPPCTGPVTYTGRAKAEADIANLKAAADGATERFMSAASPGIIAGYMWDNRHYASTEGYIFALADAMKEEYDTIAQAGIILQIDCTDLTGAAGDDGDDTEVLRKQIAMRLEALDHATRDIPPERMRLHLCWGNGEGPHHTDVP